MKKAGSSLAREYYQWLVLVQVRFELETSTVVKVNMGYHYFLHVGKCITHELGPEHHVVNSA